MGKKCRVCGKKLKSHISISIGAGPVCLRKEGIKFGHGRVPPAKNQMSFDSRIDILEHYKSKLNQRVAFGEQYKKDLALQKKCEDLWGNEKFFEHLRENYVQGNIDVNILNNYF